MDDALSNTRQVTSSAEDWDFGASVVLNDLAKEPEPYFIARQDLASQLLALRETSVNGLNDVNSGGGDGNDRSEGSGEGAFRPRSLTPRLVPLQSSFGEPQTARSFGDRASRATEEVSQTFSLPNSLSDTDITHALSPASLLSWASTTGAVGATAAEGCSIGVACMDKKGHSGPMQEILKRLTRLETAFTVDIFGEEMLFQRDVESWPLVDVLITFFSSGFPQDRVLKYRKLHPEVFYVNDPCSEFILRDRGLVYERLVINHIPTARHIVVRRAPDGSGPTVVESQNYIEVDGISLKKPFVEKPISGEDHHVIVYHHEASGGGSTRLFRKTDDNRCSERSEESNIRTSGSFVYEEFIETDGDEPHDIKVYAVGVHYAFAERRRSPVAGERVQRRPDGREVRSAVELTRSEREIAYKIVKAFNMNVCGFDILRCGEKSYVCDVNGWSFVKGNEDYYDSCAAMLCDMFRRAVIMGGASKVRPGPVSVNRRMGGRTTVYHKNRVLRGVIGVFRHGDRTPKQKVKIKTSNKAVISFFSKYGRPEKELKMKNTTHMAQLLTLRDIALEELERGPDKMDGIAPSDYEKLHLFKVVLNKNYGGLKVQLKPRRVETVENLSTCTELLVVLKWGGVLTHSGMRQATQVGEALRDIVGDIVGPGQSTRQGESIPSSSVQLMSNNERRVKQTALLVGRELLRNPDLPEEFIIDNTLSKELLDDVSQADSIIEQQKRELHEIMHVSDASEVNDLPTLRALVPRPRYHMECVHKLMKELQIVSGSLHFCGGEPVDVLLDRWKRLRADFYDPVRGKFDTTKIPDIFDFVTYEVQHNQKALKYSSSALPGLDLYHLFDKAERMARFLVPKEYGVRARDKLVIGSVVSGPLFNSICDDVCAISGVDEKARSTFTGEEPDTAMGIPLIPDEGLSGVFGSEGHGPTTRLYFTSESHLQTLRNVLIHNGVSQLHDLIEPVELNYLTHILFLVWEDVPTFTEESSHERVDVGSLDDFNSSPLESVSAPQLPLPFDQDDRVFVEVRFSAGASKNPWGITGEHYNEVGPAVTLHNHMPLATLEGIRRIVSELMTRQPDP